MQERITRVFKYPRPPHEDDILKRIPLDATVYAYWVPEQSIQIKVLVVAEILTHDHEEWYEIRPVFARGEMGDKGWARATEMFFREER